MTNERGRSLRIDGSRKRWTSVTVLDHPGIEDYTPAKGSVVLLRRDWEFLFDQLKSTYAVLEYIERITKDSPVPLGHEPVRYYQLATADSKAPKEEIDPRLAALDVETRSAPLLPFESVAYGEIVRIVLEDISSSPWPEETDHAVVLDILGAIDAAPVAHRAELGRVILAWLDEVLHGPADEVRWRFRRLMFPDRPHLIFGAASRFDAMVQEAFESLVSLRHQQHLEVLPERKDVRTVGILLTPRRDGRRPWDTTLAATDVEQGLEGDLRTSLEKMWGPFNTHLHPGGQS
jgi:hypothetical protein